MKRKKSILKKLKRAYGRFEKSYAKKVEKAMKKKVTSKRVLRKGKLSVKIPEYKAPSILGDENRFFRGEFNKEKKRLFFQ